MVKHGSKRFLGRPRIYVKVTIKWIFKKQVWKAGTGLVKDTQNWKRVRVKITED
jgi:hypothetical protein